MSSSVSGGGKAGDSLTPLRGVAACCVMLFHVFGAIPSLQGKWPTIWMCLEKAYLWVDFFFILSGFIISMAYGKALASGSCREKVRFLVLRLVRIYPLHVVTLCGLICLDVFVSHVGKSGADPFSLPSRSLQAIPLNLLLIHSLGFHDGFSWNVPSWSISCEWATYVLYSIASGVVFRLQRSFSYAGVFVGFWLYAIFCLVYGDLSATTDWGVCRCVIGFFTGASLFGLADDRRVSDWGSSAVYLLTIALLFAVFFLASWTGFDAVVIPGFSVAVVVMYRPASRVRSVTLESPVLRFIGEISYSIYLVHWLFIASVPALLERLLSYDVRSGVGASLAAFVISVLTVVASAGTYYFVECPPRRMVKAWMGS